MKKASGSIATAVTAIAEPIAESLGLVLWDVEYVKEGSEMILRITIDKEEGITIEDCEAMHRAIDPALDEADPIDGSYHLEVSSPGIERELKTDAHIAACIGWDVEVRLYAPIDGAKTYVGELAACEDPEKISVFVEPDGEERRFDKSAVASLRTRYCFDDSEA